MAVRRAETVLLVTLSLLLATAYAVVHATAPLGPGISLPAASWFGWDDQGAYLRAVEAWASFDLDPMRHHYPAGYALMGAAFLWLTPEQPFYFPNLLCWIGSLWVFAAIAALLARGAPGMRGLGGSAFFFATVVFQPAFYTWEIPWTSTPAATLTFVALLFGLRYAERGLEKDLFLTACAAGSIILFRPTDAAFLMAGTGLFLLFQQVSKRSGYRRLGRFFLVGGAGYALGLALLAVTHLATHGVAAGAYFTQSQVVGFEWRLLPIRWVTLMLQPQPLFSDGRGYAQVFWFIMPGMIGILTMVFTDIGRRSYHLLVGGSAISFVCLYLTYGDLNVQGLFMFHNHHYFKWTVPVFALYACALPYALLRQRWAPLAFAAGIVGLCGLFRPEFRPDAAAPIPTVLADGSGLALPQGLAGIRTAIMVAAPDKFLSIYHGTHRLEQNGQVIGFNNSAFKTVPMPFGLMLTPLRDLPEEPAVLRFAPSVRLDPAARVIVGQQWLVFGLPCSINPGRKACHPGSPLAPR